MTITETEYETRRARDHVRRELLAAFIRRQEAVFEYLSLEDVVRAWAPLRKESSLAAAKESARADLIEGALDGHIPELLYLHLKVALEHVIDADGKLFDPVSPDGTVAHLDAAALDRLLEIGPLPREGIKIYLTKDMGPHCWARREAVVAFLSKRGVECAAMPPAWFMDLPGVVLDNNGLAPKATDAEINVTSATQKSSAITRHLCPART
jgi:hypothetical protein